MLKDFDQIIKQEIYLDHLKIKDTGEKRFRDLLTWIVGALESGKTVKEVKRYIRKYDVDPNLEKNVKEFMEFQNYVITGKEQTFDLNSEAFGGYTFKEAIENRRNMARKRAIEFMMSVREALKK